MGQRAHVDRRSRRSVWVPAILALASIAIGWVALSATTDGSGDRVRHATAESPSQRCPRHAQPLGAAAIARATDAVLADAGALFRGKDLRGLRAVNAQIAARDNRGSYALAVCGRRVFRRTAVVTVEFPAMEPSASLSSSTVLVARVRDRFVVWETVH